LPDDFQTAEYLLHHGLLDLIVPRSFLKQALSETITLYKDAPFKRPGIIPHGIQKNISFVSEEKVRRKWNNWITQSKTSPSFSASFASLEQDTSDQKEEQEALYSSFKESDISDISREAGGDVSEACFATGDVSEAVSDLSYRDFLMSFQTMFDLFSVDPNSLTSPKVIRQHRFLCEANPKGMGQGGPASQQVQAQEGDVSSTEKNPLISSTNVLEDSISIAKNEIIEWRASYVTQNLEPKISFLKDFSEQFKEKNNISSKTDKKFFYRTVLLPTD